MLKNMGMKLIYFFFIIFMLSLGNFTLSSSLVVFDKVCYILLIINFIVFYISFSSKPNMFMNKNKIFLSVSLTLMIICQFFFLSMKFIWIFILFEMSVLPIFLIISGWGYQLERIQASYYILLYTAFFSFPFYIFFLIYSNSIFFLKSHTVLSEILFFLFMSLFMVKCPIYFFHLWLPKAHVESPVTGSIILAGVLLKLGGYGLLRVVMFFLSSKMMFFFLVLLTSIGGGMAVFISFFQSDQKSIIAYASVGHMTIISSVFFSFYSFSLKAGIFLMFLHGLVSSLMFFLSYLFFLTTNNRLIFLNQGIFYYFSFMGCFFIILTLLNFSVPPFPTFFTELMSMVGLLIVSKTMFLVVSVVLFVGCCFSMYLLVNSIHGKPFTTLVNLKSCFLNSFLTMSNFFFMMFFTLTSMF